MRIKGIDVKVIANRNGIYIVDTMNKGIFIDTQSVKLADALEDFRTLIGFYYNY